MQISMISRLKNEHIFKKPLHYQCQRVCIGGGGEATSPLCLKLQESRSRVGHVHSVSVAFLFFLVKVLGEHVETLPSYNGKCLETSLINATVIVLING